MNGSRTTPQKQPPKVVESVFAALLSYDPDDHDPGFGGVSKPVEEKDGAWTITLMDMAMSAPVAVVTVKAQG